MERLEMLMAAQEAGQRRLLSLQDKMTDIDAEIPALDREPKRSKDDQNGGQQREFSAEEMKLMILCVWTEPALLGSTKTALKFRHEI